MCSREEIQKIVDASERRMEDKVNADHMATSQMISNLFGDEQEHRKRIQERLDKILVQTTKTNGRVSVLETWREVHMSENTSLVDKVESIRTVLQRLNWLLISAVAVAVLNLVLT